MRRQTQADAVEKALQNLGGYATLGELYKRVDTRGWGTKTPFATIRRILQKDPRFFRIRPGLWGLTAHQQQILQQLAIGGGATPTQQQAFDHTYYQGLVVQIGNLRGYQTYVPPADRNKRFLDTPLGELATIDRLPPFTYDDFVQRASTIDVVWLQERKQERLFPYAFFEIEHTTDFVNSLVKFTELQDFRAHFYIVASKQREREYQQRVEASAFQPIRDFVRFIDYEALVNLYEREVQASITRL